MLIRVTIIFAVILSANAFDLSLVQELISINHNLTKCKPPMDSFIKMFDASAKMPSGVLKGNFLDLGNFDECLAIEDYNNATEETILGKYCLVKLQLMSKKSKLSDTYEISQMPEILHLEERILLQYDGIIGLILGWCVPHECQIDQLVDALNIILPVDLTLLKDGMCQTKEDLVVEYDTNDIFIIIFFAITLLLILLSTVYDLYIEYYEKKPTHILFTAFSVKTNGKKLLHTSNNANQLSCLNGIRFISMMWVIISHKYQTFFMGPITNLADFFKWVDKPINQYIMNATVAVDSFFVLSGLLVSYVFCLSMQKGVKFNIFQYYIHRYLRLTPVLAVVVWFHASLISYVGSGPLWSLHTLDKKDCEDYWWAALLYIQNYYNIDNKCVSHTWYLSVDMQLYILSPLLLIPLWKWPKKTLAVCSVLLLGSMAIPFTLSYIYKFRTSMMDSQLAEGDYLKDYYYPTHTRYGPWLIGFILGYYLFLLNKDKNKINLSPIQVLLGWILGLGLLLTTLFTGYELSDNPNVYANSFYNACFRHGWSLGLSWVIFACTQGYGGPINNFLSWSVFQVLSRFTYTMYLSHYTILFLMIYASRTTVQFTDFQVMFLYWGDFMLNLILCFGLILAFESPMMTIEKVLFGNVKKNKPESVVAKVEEGQTNDGFERKY